MPHIIYRNERHREADGYRHKALDARLQKDPWAYRCFVAAEQVCREAASRPEEIE